MKCLYFGVLAACLFSSGAVLSAEKGSLPYSTNSADEVACQRQLNRILGAIQEYQKRNQTLPPSLSDLVPEYIHDRTTLICPFVRCSGIQRKWRSDFVSVPVFGDPAYSSYAYEFSTQAFPFVLGWTTRTYKERLLELIGLSVPILPCP